MEKKELTNWQAIQIGALAGCVPILLFVSSYASGQWDMSFLDLIMFTFAIGWPIMPLGIAGALIARKSSRARRAIWIGAVMGTILGIIIVPILFWSWLMNNVGTFS